MWAKVWPSAPLSQRMGPRRGGHVSSSFEARKPGHPSTHPSCGVCVDSRLNGPPAFAF